MGTDKIAPCKGCESREVGCHSKCPKYAEFRAEKDRIRAKRKEEHEVSRTGMEYSIKVNRHYHKAGMG